MRDITYYISVTNAVCLPRATYCCCSSVSDRPTCQSCRRRRCRSVGSERADTRGGRRKTRTRRVATSWRQLRDTNQPRIRRSDATALTNVLLPTRTPLSAEHTTSQTRIENVRNGICKMAEISTLRDYELTSSWQINEM